MLFNGSLDGVFDNDFCFPQIIEFSIAYFKKSAEDHVVTFQLGPTHCARGRIYHKYKVCLTLYFNISQVLHGDVMSSLLLYI